MPQCSAARRASGKPRANASFAEASANAAHMRMTAQMSAAICFRPCQAAVNARCLQAGGDAAAPLVARSGVVLSYASSGRRWRGAYAPAPFASVVVQEFLTMFERCGVRRRSARGAGCAVRRARCCEMPRAAQQAHDSVLRAARARAQCSACEAMKILPPGGKCRASARAFAAAAMRWKRYAMPVPLTFPRGVASRRRRLQTCSMAQAQCPERGSKMLMARRVRGAQRSAALPPCQQACQRMSSRCRYAALAASVPARKHAQRRRHTVFIKTTIVTANAFATPAKTLKGVSLLRDAALPARCRNRHVILPFCCSRFCPSRRPANTLRRVDASVAHYDDADDAHTRSAAAMHMI